MAATTERKFPCGCTARVDGAAVLSFTPKCVVMKRLAARTPRPPIATVRAHFMDQVR